TIHAGTHVDGLDHEPDLGRRRVHGSCRTHSASHGALPPAISIRQPPGLVSRTTLPAAGVPMLTGTRVRDDVAAAAVSFSLCRQR
ncbi:MAG: hypothetical protein R6W97_06380, partial [Thiobacillus sp.]